MKDESVKGEMKRLDHREIAKQLIENRRRFTVEGYTELATVMTAEGGKVVHANVDDDDWCFTGRIPWPPKKFDSILEVMAKLGGAGRIIINGIPVPEYIDVIVTRDRLR